MRIEQCNDGLLCFLWLPPCFTRNF